MKIIYLFLIFNIIFIIPLLADDQEIEDLKQYFYEVDIYEDIVNKNAEYNVYDLVENSNITLFYGNNNNEIPSHVFDCTALGEGLSHLVYYKSPGTNYFIYSILILGTYHGDPDKSFYFEIEDLNGNIIYKSILYKYDTFINESFTLKEFIINDNISTNEFIIKVITYSEEYDNLHISHIESEYIYSYINVPDGYPFNYDVCPDYNWGIFVKFKEATTN